MAVCVSQAPQAAAALPPAPSTYMLPRSPRLATHEPPPTLISALERRLDVPGGHYIPQAFLQLGRLVYPAGPLGDLARPQPRPLASKRCWNRQRLSTVATLSRP
jgi:hypothetical protein